MLQQRDAGVFKILSVAEAETPLYTISVICIQVAVCTTYYHSLFLQGTL